MNVFAENNSANVVEVKSEKLTVYYGKRIAEYYGNVLVKYDGTDIYCDKAEVFYSNPQEGTGEKKYGAGRSSVNVIKFYGNVLIDSKENKAYSDYGVFTKSNNLVVLERNVRLKDKKGEVMGSKLVYNVTTKKMKLVNNVGNKRVKAVISE